MGWAESQHGRSLAMIYFDLLPKSKKAGHAASLRRAFPKYIPPVSFSSAIRFNQSQSNRALLLAAMERRTRFSVGLSYVLALNVRHTSITGILWMSRGGSR